MRLEICIYGAKLGTIKEADKFFYKKRNIVHVFTTNLPFFFDNLQVVFNF